MKKSDFYYDLPAKLIAQMPAKNRTASRLLVIDPVEKKLEDRVFTDFINLVDQDDLLVFNNTRVIPARLFGEKVSTGGKVEVLIERVMDQNNALVQIRASKTPKTGQALMLENVAECTVAGREGEFYILQFSNKKTVIEWLEECGRMPLPPYIERSAEEIDLSRYQTVFASRKGAVAAPTAGLHFDEPMMQQIMAKGIETAEVTLHVGAGTFQPVRVDDLSMHKMHAEWVSVSEDVCEKIAVTKARGGRVVAVGTTVVRSLESAAQATGDAKPFEGDTRLFILPGYEFKVVDAMLTNFHLPESTLLMLISAFAGRDFVMQAYQHAIEQSYRFFSYGDAMFIKRRLS